MQIQINSDNVLHVPQEKANYYSNIIREDLKIFSDQIARVEVHFTDQNGIKTGTSDIRRVMEARLEGLQPVAVSNQADHQEDALTGAINKLKSSLQTIKGKLSSH